VSDVNDRFAAQLLAFVRGDADVLDLPGSGLEITVGPTSTVVHEPAGLPAVRPSAADVARGLVTHLDRGTARNWAKVMLMVTSIDLDDAGDRLLDALWSASAEEPIAPAVLDAARELAGHS
jgi:hypothetical protein